MWRSNRCVFVNLLVMSIFLLENCIRVHSDAFFIDAVVRKRKSIHCLHVRSSLFFNSRFTSSVTFAFNSLRCISVKALFFTLETFSFLQCLSDASSSFLTFVSSNLFAQVLVVATSTTMTINQEKNDALRLSVLLHRPPKRPVET